MNAKSVYNLRAYATLLALVGTAAVGCVEGKGDCEGMSSGECADAMTPGPEVTAPSWESVGMTESDGSVSLDGWHFQHDTHNTPSDTDPSINYPVAEHESALAEWSCASTWENYDGLYEDFLLENLSTDGTGYGLPGLRLNEMWVEHTGTRPEEPGMLLSAPRNIRVHVTDYCGEVGTTSDVPVTINNAVQWSASVPPTTAGASTFDSPVGPSLCPWSVDFAVTVLAGQPDLYDSPTAAAYDDGHVLYGTHTAGADTVEDAMADEVCAAYQTTWAEADADPSPASSWAADVMGGYTEVEYGSTDTRFAGGDLVTAGEYGPTITFSWSDLVAPEEKDRCTMPDGGTHEEPGFVERVWDGFWDGFWGRESREDDEDGIRTVVIGDELVDLECGPAPYVQYELMERAPDCEAGEAEFAWVGPVLTHKGYVFIAAPLDVSSGTFGLGARWEDDGTLANGDWRTAEQVEAIEEDTFTRAWTCDAEVTSTPYPLPIERAWKVTDLPLDIAGEYAVLVESIEGDRSMMQVLIPGYPLGSVTLPMKGDAFRYLGHKVKLGEDELTIWHDGEELYSLPIKQLDI